MTLYLNLIIRVQFVLLCLLQWLMKLLRSQCLRESLLLLLVGLLSISGTDDTFGIVLIVSEFIDLHVMLWIVFCEALITLHWWFLNVLWEWDAWRIVAFTKRLSTTGHYLDFIVCSGFPSLLLISIIIELQFRTTLNILNMMW
jgi:hypothetical protein